MAPEPRTLQEAVLYFSDPVNCRDYVAVRRWPNGVTCPRCGSDRVTFLDKYGRWQCSSKHDRRQFTIKTGTIFEDSPLPLDKWLMAMWLAVNCKNGVSSWEIHRAMGVTQKTAWFMLHRVRRAMQDEAHGGKIGGDIEVDETFIGGKARNMHTGRKIRAQQGGRNTGGKTAVLGILERGKTIRATVLDDRSSRSIQPIVKQHVAAGSNIFSDEHGDNWRMDALYNHEVVNHLAQYVDGNVHTNGVENFWSCLKRTIGGTYVSVEPFHLFRYVDEQAFRYNNRKPMNDGERFSFLVRKVVGKRLTYKELTGKTGDLSETEEVF